VANPSGAIDRRLSPCSFLRIQLCDQLSRAAIDFRESFSGRFAVSHKETSSPVRRCHDLALCNCTPQRYERLTDPERNPTSQETSPPR